MYWVNNETKIDENVQKQKHRKTTQKNWAPTYDTLLWWQRNNAAMERLLDRHLLIETEEVTETPPHREGLIPEHGQGGLEIEIQIDRFTILY